MKNLIWKYFFIYIIGSIILGVIVFLLGYITPPDDQAWIRFIFSSIWLIVVTMLYSREKRKRT
ncbi:uncharacterized protein (DUF983 family) [Scopulibacillus daqui]|uniref:Uncharacterized protein (DUF983 family) n=1 Tax=Scopulibacillus daqui TaxID=1469162 RepID=A0ABS2PWZ6_9BACL|nr:uncharacterized protein (DUF983 family) [Scopulibacillus daqui]